MRILLVDDDADLGDLLAELFSLAGHEVAVALNPTDGLALARKLGPALVFCDLNMRTSMDGLSLVRGLRAEPATAGAHIVALTGTDLSACEAEARKAGFDRVLLKPVAIEKIEAIVAERSGKVDDPDGTEGP